MSDPQISDKPKQPDLATMKESIPKEKDKPRRRCIKEKRDPRGPGPTLPGKYNVPITKYLINKSKKEKGEEEYRNEGEIQGEKGANEVPRRPGSIIPGSPNMPTQIQGRKKTIENKSEGEYKGENKGAKEVKIECV